MGLHNSYGSIEKTPAATWTIPAAIIGVSGLIMLGGATASEWLRYDRVWIGQGEVWRLLSGHVAHLGWSHLALNSTGLVLIWFLVGGAQSIRAWILIIAISIAAIDIGFWLQQPQLHWYVGMSGFLHGILAAGIVSRLRHLQAETVVLAVLLVAKIAWEQLSGPLPGSEATSGGPVVVAAHLYGALGGALGAFLVGIRVRSRAPI
jgi:rhomboid family GlyGly-CTERM serine protease